ncbi:MAG: gliding motility-associated ABC transporter substrate-binding protein GldG [Paludibacter sp.]
MISILTIIGIALFYHFRLDLTSDKRYSISNQTKNLMEKLDEPLKVTVYLDGDLNPGFQRLKISSGELLDELSVYTEKGVEINYQNPSIAGSQEQREKKQAELEAAGFTPTAVYEHDKEGKAIQKIIFPWIELSYKAKKVPVCLLKNIRGNSGEENLNISIENLEFEITDAIRRLVNTEVSKIAFMEGHGELTEPETYDISKSLSRYFQIDRGVLGTNAAVLDNYKVIIVAKPTKPFSESDKFIIDQYIMYGGKVLWLIDPVFASMDSLKGRAQTVGITNEINLADQLFRYGVRLNTNLIMDISALPIPIVTGKVGNQPQTSFLPWYYFPIITPTANHPIVKNVNAIKTEFVSSIDTIDNGIKKTILLTSSKYSRLINTPVIIDLAILKKEPEERLFNKPFQSVAVLLEGEFESNFSNRVTSEIAQSDEIGFISKSKLTSMIVVSDGDMIKSQFHYSKGYPMPLGYDQYTGQMFGNKEFILNCMNYLCDDSGLITVRSRELKLRMLDKTKIENSKIKWQLINIVFPILIVIIFGFLMAFLRKRRYTK